jgi:hypothetical protein
VLGDVLSTVCRVLYCQGPGHASSHVKIKGSRAGTSFRPVASDCRKAQRPQLMAIEGEANFCPWFPPMGQGNLEPLNMS